MPPHVVLVGSMAVGKSTVGRRLAARLGRPFRDSDDDLSAALGITGRELAERDGVDALHRWEAEHLQRSVAPSARPAVVAAAASVVDDPACRAALRDPFVVWLRAPARVLAERMEGDAHEDDDHRRRMGDRGADDEAAAAVAVLDARRADRFADVADLTVDTVAHGKAAPVDRIVAAIVAALPPGAAGRRDPRR